MNGLNEYDKREEQGNKHHKYTRYLLNETLRLSTQQQFNWFMMELIAVTRHSN